MKNKYKVKWMLDEKYEVIQFTTILGSRTSAYESEEDETTESSVFQGTLSDCESYIRLYEGGYMI